MKYNIEGLSQEALVENELDIADAMILRWFIDFCGSGRMHGFSQDGKAYYRVDFGSIIEEFPILGISSIKGISKRFDRYVEKGLFVKIVRHGSSSGGGTAVFFSPTEKLSEMMYSPSKIKEKENKKAEENSSSVRVSENEAEKNSGSCPKGTPVPAEKNSSSVRLNNPSIINSSTNSSFSQEISFKQIPEGTAGISAKETEDPERETERSLSAEKLIISEALEELFGDTKVFSDDFEEKLENFIRENNLKAEDYLIWTYNSINPKKISNIPSYFYKTSLSDKNLSLFKFEQLKAIEEAEKKKGKSADIRECTCPVCNTKNKMYEDCKSCGITWNETKNTEKVQLYRRIFNLAEDKKQSLTEEIDECRKKLFHAENISMVETELNKIYEKYGVLA